MVEVTQETAGDIAAALKHLGWEFVADLHYWAKGNDIDRFDALVQAFAAHRQAAFNAGRASVLAELESPSEAMLKAGIESDIWNGKPVIRRTVDEVFTAMIDAYKEAL